MLRAQVGERAPGGTRPQRAQDRRGGSGPCGAKPCSRSPQSLGGQSARIRAASASLIASNIATPVSVPTFLIMSRASANRLCRPFPAAFSAAPRSGRYADAGVSAACSRGAGDVAAPPRRPAATQGARHALAVHLPTLPAVATAEPPDLADADCAAVPVRGPLAPWSAADARPARRISPARAAGRAWSPAGREGVCTEILSSTAKTCSAFARRSDPWTASAA